MNYLSAEGLSKSFDTRILFKDISFHVDQGQKIALVGANGSGKTTLLRILAGSESPDSGKVSFGKDIKVGFLPQQPVFDQPGDVLQWVLSAPEEPFPTLRAYEEALWKSQQGDEKATETLGELMERMDVLQAWDIDSQIRQILGKLDIHDLHQDIRSLSGGQRKRVALAKTLIQKPDLLILDEPTNHLDIQSIEWLESYLDFQNITLLLVTHDRYFLQKVCNDIIELDGGNLYRYKGTYGQYLEKKAAREELEVKEVEKARNLMRKELEWVRRQPKARGTKAKYRLDAFEDLKEKAGKKLGKAEVEIQLSTQRQGGKILEVTHLCKRFGEKNIINDFSYTFRKREKIGLVGANGAGKSTLINMLTGHLAADSGSISPGITTVFGYYTQEDFPFKEDMRVIDAIQEVAEVIPLKDGSEITASQLLQRFLFSPEQQYSIIAKLSGGEKRRLQLLRVLMLNPNFLILDEPTNDLDIPTLNVLEDYLEQFEGSLLVVSHDRYFMDRLVEHLFVLEGEGKWSDFPGNYTEYRLTKDEEEKTQAQKEKEKAKNIMANHQPIEEKKPEQASAKRKASYKEQKEYEQLEKEIEKLENQKSQLVEQLNTGTDYEQLSLISKELEIIEEALEAKSMRWLELSELIEG